MSVSEPEQWYWDLSRKRAVRATARGLGTNTLGPYNSEAEAENWQSLIKERNDSWDGDDAAWTTSDTDDQ